jgi:hypothetical protein
MQNLTNPPTLDDDLDEFDEEEEVEEEDEDEGDLPYPNKE